MKVVGRAMPKVIRALDRRMVVERLGRNCHWCGIYTDDSIYNTDSPRKTTIDHLYNRLDPRRRGNDDKVVVACEACNLMRARMHEYIFGWKYPINFALEFEEPEPVAEIVVEKPVPQAEPIVVLNPPFQGPRIVKDVPLPTKWQRFVAFVSKMYRRLWRTTSK